MILNTVKSVAKQLAKLGMAAPEEHSHVRTVKIKGSDGEDAPVEELDLLRAREWVSLIVDEEGKHMDRTDCQQKLVTALQDRKFKFEEQKSR